MRGGVGQADGGVKGCLVELGSAARRGCEMPRDCKIKPSLEKVFVYLFDFQRFFNSTPYVVSDH